MPTAELTRKIAILGARAIGKSTLTTHFVNASSTDTATANTTDQPQASSEYIPTIHQQYTKHLTLPSASYTLEIIDTAGQDTHSHLPQNVCLGTHGYLLCFAITSQESFTIACSIYDKIANYFGTGDVLKIVLVGTKSDLEPQRRVGKDDALRKASEWKCKYVECSSVSGVNTGKVFEVLLEEIDGGVNSSGGGNKCVVM